MVKLLEEIFNFLINNFIGTDYVATKMKLKSD